MGCHFYDAWFRTLLYIEGAAKFLNRKKFYDIFRISGRSFGPKFDCPFIFYTFELLSAQNREKSDVLIGRLFAAVFLSHSHDL